MPDSRLCCKARTICKLNVFSAGVLGFSEVVKFQ